jgi:hypothetical protein
MCKCISTGEDEMNTIKIMAIVLIMACSLGLVYGGFTYTRNMHEAKLVLIKPDKDSRTVIKDELINSGQPYTGDCPFSLTGKPQSKTITIHYEYDRASNGENHGKLI